MDFKQLESFVSVVKHQSFTKAAEKLYISQPTISTHIRLLEDELQSRLIIRTTKSIEITPRGWELFECASGILKMRDQLVEEWSGDAKKIIYLGASSIPSAYILPEVLPAFGKRFPDVFFDMKQSDSQEIIEQMKQDKYNVALVGMPCTDERLACESFYRDRIVLITPVTEPYLSWRGKQTLSAKDFFNEPIILREQGSGSQKTAGIFFEKNGIKETELHVAARINDQESIKNLVASGLGISLVSEKAVRNFVEEKKVLMFELPQDESERNLYLLYNREYILKPFIKSFISFVKDFYE